VEYSLTELGHEEPVSTLGEWALRNRGRIHDANQVRRGEQGEQGGARVRAKAKIRRADVWWMAGKRVIGSSFPSIGMCAQRIDLFFD